MSLNNVRIIKDNKLKWVLKHRCTYFTRTLLHRVYAKHITKCPEILDKALKINMLAFTDLILDHRIGVIHLSETAYLIPSHLVLGRGASSILKVAFLFEDKGLPELSVRRVALRLPNNDKENGSSYAPGSYARNEAQKSLYDHPNIEANALYMGEIESEFGVQEFTVEEIWSMSLIFSLLNKDKTQAIDTLKIIHSMAKGLQYLHSYNLIHRDIKPGNVLVRRDEAGELHVQLSDLESIYPETERKIPFRGTKSFVPPETVMTMEKRSTDLLCVQTKAGDMYALGQSILNFRQGLFYRAIRRAGRYEEAQQDSLALKISTSLDNKPLNKKEFKGIMARLSKNGAFEGYEYVELILTTLEDLARQLMGKPDERPTAAEVVDLLDSLLEVTDFKQLAHSA